MYGTLYNSCHPRGNANTDNTKFRKEVSVTPIVEKPETFPTADPTKWGPHLWSYLHYSAINYPIKPSKQQQKSMKQWLTCLSATIPCKNCSTHYNKYIQQHFKNLDVICASRDTLFNFLVDIHNKVNKRNGKREVGYDEARWLYRSKK